MGCTTSKLDDLEALSLCRRRCDLLSQAISHRFALADAHSAYSLSLLSVSSALHRVLHNTTDTPPSVLPLPPDRKLPSPPPAPRTRSRSHSGSHIHFHSDNSDSDSISPLHSDPDSPPHRNIHYARPNPPPRAISVEQRAKSPDQVQYVSDYSYPGNSYYGFFGASYPASGAGRGGGDSKASSSRRPASPPRASAWDYLNPFEGAESYYRSYSPSRSSREVREDEGIPDLEEEEDEEEVIKEAYGDEKFADLSPERRERSEDVGAVEGEDVGVVVEKNVVEREVERPREVGRGVVGARRYGNLSEVAGEIRAQFEGAAELMKEVARMLEVGKHAYDGGGKGCASAGELILSFLLLLLFCCLLC